METLKTQSAYSRALKTLAICTAISTVGLTACHNDHDSVPTTNNTNGMVTLSGTAATGAALKNASVTASCKNNSGFSTPVSTNDKGQWTGQVLATNLPCALQAKTADLALHSYATAAGNVNITPLTDLSIAMISRKNPADWFKQYQVLLESQLKAATDEIAKQLASKNYVLPEEFNLFNSTFAIGDAFDKMLDALMAAITSSSLKNYNALLNQVVATGSTASIPAAMPTPPNNTRSCASRKLPVTTLNSITDYSGVYKNKGTTVFNLDTATAQIIASGNTAMVTEVCGPNVLNNGTNHVLVTDKGYVTLFKDNNGKYSAETSDFGGFYGEKAAANSTPCESNGADDKLGFKNAPQDFCSFSKASSVAISSPDIYTFFNADKTQNIKITVENKAIKSVQLEDNTYAWACGIGSYAACSGITFDQRNASFVQFPFNNVVLTPVYGTQQPITIKNGLLIHIPSNTSANTLKGGAATGNVKNVQLNKDGSATGGSGEFRTTEYDFKGNLDGQFNIGLYDTRQYLRYELTGQNRQFNSIKLYSNTNTTTPLFVYECHTTTRCGNNITLTQGTTSSLKFNNVRLNGVYQPQFDIDINGEVILNP